MNFFKNLSDIKLFFLSILLGVICVFAAAAYTQWDTPPRLALRELTENILITEQLTLEEVKALHQYYFKTVIDLRPDGETPDQPSSSEIGTLIKENKMTFAYVPVPHGDIPDSAVDALAKAISESPKPILMYCRSGKRAARTWSLVEASRVGGL